MKTLDILNEGFKRKYISEFKDKKNLHEALTITIGGHTGDKVLFDVESIQVEELGAGYDHFYYIAKASDGCLYGWNRYKNHYEYVPQSISAVVSGFLDVEEGFITEVKNVSVKKFTSIPIDNSAVYKTRSPITYSTKAVQEDYSKKETSSKSLMNKILSTRPIKESATPYGGDQKNFYMFYIGPTSGSVSRKDVIDFAKKHGCDSIYWASSDATGYKASYNGDTLVIFNKKDINRMPDDYKEDAKKYGRIINESLLSSLKEGWSGRYSPRFLSAELGIDKDEAKRFSDYLFKNSYDAGFTTMREAADDGLLDDWYEEFKESGSSEGGETPRGRHIYIPPLDPEEAVEYLESKGISCDPSDAYGKYACDLLDDCVFYTAWDDPMYANEDLNIIIKKVKQAKANHIYDEEEAITESFSR